MPQINATALPDNWGTLPFQEAIDAMATRGVVLPAAYYGELQGIARQLAFSIAGDASLSQLTAVGDSLKQYMANGGNFNNWKKEQAVMDLGLPKHRLDNIWRTNLQGQYMAGHWEQFNSIKTPLYLMYDAINDSRTRPAHLALDGIIREKGDAFFATHSPPCGYRCRCSLIALTKSEAEKRSGGGKGLNQQPVMKLKDGSIVPAKPDKGWGYDKTNRLAGIQQAIKEKLAKLPEGNLLKLAAIATLAKSLSAIESTAKTTMTLDKIMEIATEVKPEFDGQIQQIANSINGRAILPPLKSVERAQAKINHLYDGDATLIRDVLRASIITESKEQVETVYQNALANFTVVENSYRNSYETPINSSDGYFDARLDVSFGGIFAEIQIHTQAMVDAKEHLHSLYEKKQAINRQAIKDGVRLTPEQKKEVESLNKQMREIYREASNG